MPDRHRAGSLRPFGRFTLLAAICAFALLAAGHLLDYHLHADDDHLFLYYAAQSLGRSDDARLLNEAVVDAMGKHGISGDPVIRFQVRADYLGNYLLPTAIYRGVSGTLRLITASGDADYPRYLASAMVTGFGVVFLLVCVALLASIWALRDPRPMVAFAVTLTVVAGLEVLWRLRGATTFVGGPELFVRSVGDLQTLKALVVGTCALLLNPNIGFSPFAETPRSHILLLAALVFLYRWRARHDAAYAMLFALSFVHQSYTGLLLVFLVATDLIVAPTVFLRWPAALFALGTLVVFAGRDTLLTAFAGVAGWQVVAMFFVAAAVALLAGSPATGRAAGRVRALMRRRPWIPLGMDPRVADLLVIGLLWGGSLPVAWVMNRNLDPEISQYFWAQVHGRALALFRVAFVLGASLWLVDRAWDRVHASRMTTLIGLTALGVTVAALAAASPFGHPVETLRSEFIALDRKAGASAPWDDAALRDETVIYYRMIRALDVAAAGVPARATGEMKLP